MNNNLDKVIAQILGPLMERRDYVPHGKDMLEQNVDILKKKKKFPKELDEFFKKRRQSLSRENARGLETINRTDKYNTIIDCSIASSEHIIKAIMNEVAIIKRCPKKDKDERPDSKQQWCLYTKDEDRLLGRHPTKEKALAQERVVQIHKHKN